MLYRLFLRGGDGRPLTLSGFKVVEDDPGSDLWTDTTTRSRILGGTGAEDEATRGRGVGDYQDLLPRLPRAVDDLPDRRPHPGREGDRPLPVWHCSFWATCGTSTPAASSLEPVLVRTREWWTSWRQRS